MMIGVDDDTVDGDGRGWYQMMMDNDRSLYLGNDRLWLWKMITISIDDNDRWCL